MSQTVSTIDAYFDQPGDGRAEADLAALLRDDADAVERFVERAELHTVLHRALHRRARQQQSRGMSEAKPGMKMRVQGSGFRVHDKRVPRSAFRIASLLAAAAAVVLIVSGWFILTAERRADPVEPRAEAPSRSITTVMQASGSLLVGDQPARPGVDYAAGPVVLESGTAELILASGTLLRLEGPTEMTVSDPMNATLTRGTLHVLVPPGATGFAIDAPGGVRVIDRGTEFIMQVGPADVTHVDVLDGMVEMIVTASDRTRPTQRVRLLAGEQAIGSLGRIETRNRFGVEGSMFDAIIAPDLFTAADGGAARSESSPGRIVSLRSSPLLEGSRIEDLFGAERGTIEPGRVLFANGGTPDNGNAVLGDGDETVDFVEWTTQQPVSLAGYRLVLEADGGVARGPRSTGMVRLLVDGRIIDAVHARGEHGVLLRRFAEGPITGQTFRLELTRMTAGADDAGPRLVELDAMRRADAPAATQSKPKTNQPTVRN